MRTSQTQYSFRGLPNNHWTIIEHCADGDLDYELELESFDAARRYLMWLRWIEEIYSPPRE